MDKLKIGQYKTSFDRIAHYIENEQKEQVEIWFARELQAVLGYARWENFVVAINRAVQSCKTQSINVDDHFREVTKMVRGSGRGRGVGGMERVRGPVGVGRVRAGVMLIRPSSKPSG